MRKKMGAYNYIKRERKVGEYYYVPRGRNFQIYQVTSVANGCETGKKVMGEWFTTREAARQRVYELNGWNYKGKE